MSKVSLKLVPKQSTPNKNLIEYLENRLAEAKSGELLSIYTVNYWAGDLVSSGWSGYGSKTFSPVKILGEMDLLKRDFIAEVPSS